jgi:hypothetical protein
MTKETIKFRYFKSVEGKVVQRYGTERFIGCKYIDGDWKWKTDRVVSIPETECNQYKMEYDRAIKERSILECNESGELFVKEEKPKTQTQNNDQQDPDKKKKDKKNKNANKESSRVLIIRRKT